MLQLDPLKLGSCKFNIINNIINITFKLDVTDRSNDLKYSFIEKSNIFKF